ncbi:site-specific DNA-methyltransferase [Mannheimia sp. AT1]|uniref:site-specific DNA-methyltransferase (adenine-specific) n=1 Tax=Mannheimia cairinae TaxID=3025936 RepID=A0ABT5MT58_9PAST|nr:site-specific DNA-methyltransferase [Mannheimia cairinae]MDD0824646.1 site-specific DNA-methyltransferase [Mannheimia cairinae]MDD0826425.1 site-specific DNA-methyltransferase [Mannheimia cairinae]
MEHYGLNWIGKSHAKKMVNTLPTMRFVEDKEHNSAPINVNSSNLFIEGDNLEALKLLLKTHKNAVKMIYIDPPYNTGKKFIYSDKFSYAAEDLANIYEISIDKARAKLKEFSKFELSQSAWLTFMYPRLYIARELLKDDGVIFISIDDNEQAQLKLLCDEVFGEENFLGQITVVNNPRGRDYGGIAKMHEYICVYAKSEQTMLNNLEAKNKKFPFEDDKGGFELRELRNRNIAFHKENRPNLYYPFYVDENKKLDNGLLSLSLQYADGLKAVYPKESQGFHTVWRWGKEKAELHLNTEIAGKLMNDGGYMIVEKYRNTTQMARSVWNSKEDNSEKGTLLVKKLFDGKKYFDFPKSEEMVRKMLEIGSGNNDLILDFFSGSATTAHAVMELNLGKKSNRRFICVQLPEPTDEKSEAYKAGFENIAEISKERIRRAGKQILQNIDKNQSLDVGFKVFKLTN